MFEREGLLGSLDRRAHALGFRQGYEILKELSGHEVVRPTRTRGGILLIALSVLLYPIIAALIVAGAWLLSRLQPLEFLIGAILLWLGLRLRPRLGRRRQALQNTWVLDRAKTPALFEVIDEVAAKTGAPVPQTVAFGLHWNLYVTTTGLRRHRSLVIGLPLFVTAHPQERVALLGHELGHFVNGDLRRGLLTQPAVTVFGRLAQLTRWRIPVDPPAGIGGLYVLAALALRLVSYPFYAAHVALTLVASRESRRAEHYADALSARVAGTAAALSTVDLTVHGTELERLIDGIAARQSAGGWQATVASARASWSEQLPLHRQLTLRREASAFASHPAAELRHRLLTTTPYHGPAMVLPQALVQRLDRELAAYVTAYDRYIRDLAGPSAQWI